MAKRMGGTLNGFNSKLVRLKGEIWRSLRLGWGCFNSKLVRLKVRDAIKNQDKEEFQFQTGSIKRLSKMRLSHKCQSFNSKLVRLKAPGYQVNPFIISRFNSKLVRLKVYTRLCTPLKIPNVSIPNWFD